MFGTLILLALVGLLLPVVSLFVAVYFFFAGEIALGAFFFLWFMLWDDNGSAYRRDGES